MSDKPDKTQKGPDQNEVIREIAAEELLKGQREVVILFEGERYRLRVTRRNKLILQK